MTEISEKAHKKISPAATDSLDVSLDGLHHMILEVRDIFSPRSMNLNPFYIVAGHLMEVQLIKKHPEWPAGLNFVLNINNKRMDCFQIRCHDEKGALELARDLYSAMLRCEPINFLRGFHEFTLFNMLLGRDIKSVQKDLTTQAI